MLGADALAAASALVLDHLPTVMHYKATRDRPATVRRGVSDCPHCPGHRQLRLDVGDEDLEVLCSLIHVRPGSQDAKRAAAMAAIHDGLTLARAGERSGLSRDTVAALRNRVRGQGIASIFKEDARFAEIEADAAAVSLRHVDSCTWCREHHQVLRAGVDHHFQQNERFRQADVMFLHPTLPVGRTAEQAVHCAEYSGLIARAGGSKERGRISYVRGPCVWACERPRDQTPARSTRPTASQWRHDTRSDPGPDRVDAQRVAADAQPGHAGRPHPEGARHGRTEHRMDGASVTLVAGRPPAAPTLRTNGSEDAERPTHDGSGRPAPSVGPSGAFPDDDGVAPHRRAGSKVAAVVGRELPGRSTSAARLGMWTRVTRTTFRRCRP